MASDSEFLILRHKDAKYHDLVPRFVLRRSLTGSRFEEDNSSRTEIREHRTDWITTLTLILQKIIWATSMPVMWFGYVVEFFLNFFVLNGGILGILRRTVTLSLKIPWRRDAADFRSFLGHMDNRYDLHSDLPINHLHILEPLVGLNCSPITLSVMASKLSYENAAAIKHVVTKHWKMHFVKFFSCYNKYLGNRATQAFIFCDKAENADLIVLAFRGTEPFNTIDWMTDIDLSWLFMGKLGRVHLGFMRALGLQDEKHCEKGFPREYSSKEKGKPLAYYTIRETLKELLKKHKNAKILITGHSLGGALAILFPAILALHEEQSILNSIYGVLTYGQPRVGDAQFGEYMQSVLGKRYYRVVYRYDLVSRVPFDKPPVAEFKHFGTCIYFKSWYEGEVVDDSPNPNYIDPTHLISMHFSALDDLIKAVLLRLARMKEFEESLVSLLFRASGLLFPGVSCHSLRDYVISGKMAKIKHNFLGRSTQ